MHVTNDTTAHIEHVSTWGDVSPICVSSQNCGGTESVSVVAPAKVRGRTDIEEARPSKAQVTWSRNWLITASQIVTWPTNSQSGLRIWSRVNSNRPDTASLCCYLRDHWYFFREKFWMITNCVKQIAKTNIYANNFELTKVGNYYEWQSMTQHGIKSSKDVPCEKQSTS